MKFEQYKIAQEIKDSLEDMGFRKPTDIQFKAIPNILNGEDVLAIAQTGTGKTAAFAIPIINKIVQQNYQVKKNQTKCLVMVPTRELALQIAEVFEKIAANCDVSILAITGGVSQNPQIKQLNRGVDVLIATPGRMFDLISQEALDLSNVQTLVLDEADLMLNLGFIKDIKDVMRHLPFKRQNLFFSATINKEIKEVAYKIVKRQAIRIQIAPQESISRNITHYVAHIEMDDKRFFLERLVKEQPTQKIIVFVRTKVRAERVSAALLRVGIESVMMHGGNEQDDREKVLAQFKSGEVKILITTDLNARGVDIPNVDFVVNYDMPDVAENYVHRIGRTGRGMQRGTAYSFSSIEEKPYLDAVQEFIGFEINQLKIDKETYMDTLVFTEETNQDNWQALLKDAEKKDAEFALKKKKKKK